MAEHWSRVEVEAAVAAYLEMLAAELAGRPYNKSARRRALAARLRDRSDGSIERKHQNISAVLIALGLPWIDGYKPLVNSQKLLREVVEERAAEPEFLALVERATCAEASVPAIDDWLERVTAPPRSEAPPPPAEVVALHDSLRASPHGPVNYLAREARNAALGRAGELFVLCFEQQRLRRLGKEALAERVEHVAVTLGDREGFDVRSFEADGRDRLIEVKTTAYGKETPFFVTRHELEVSLRLADRYHLYRPFRFRRDPRLYLLPGALHRTCRLEPTEYAARPAS